MRRNALGDKIGMIGGRRDGGGEMRLKQPNRLFMDRLAFAFAAYLQYWI
jgi:hypothetical protein